MSNQRFTKEDLKDKLDDNELDLSLCNLSKVPVREITSFPKATILDLSCNVLTSLPPTFSNLVQLTKLDLSKNQLTELPQDFGHLVNLERLDLFSNKLTALPSSCMHLRKLRWLDLKENPIQTLLADVVGHCLSAQECKQCANNMIQYLKQENANTERIRQQQLKIERERKAVEETNALKDRELRKRQKVKEKEERRIAFEEMERQKSLINQNVDGNTLEREFVKEESQSQQVEVRKGTRVSLFSVLLLIGCLLGTLGLVYYCSDRNCAAILKGMLQ